MVAAQPHYVGVEGCESCHKLVVASWQKGAHAKAFDSLKPGKRGGAKKKAGLDPEKDYTTDKKCLGCHSTGYGAKGGFKDVATTPKMAGVSCEACHGAGSEYKVLHDENPRFTKDQAKALGELYGAEDPLVCESCHVQKDNVFTEAVDKKYKFEWKEALQKRDSYHLKQKSQFGFGF
jgi:hypothetical protein